MAPIRDAFTEHLKLAAATLDPVRRGDTAAINAAVQAFYDQGDILAAAVSEINPEKLPVDVLEREFRTHNEYVVQLATLREQERYAEYIKVLDPYRSHMDGVSDLIYIGLTH